MPPLSSLSRFARRSRLHAVAVATFVCSIVLSQAGHALREARASAIEPLPTPTAGPAAATFDPFAPKPQALPAPDPASDRVGSTVGEFKVGEDGGANYRVPIFTVPGRAGVAPQLALTYSTRGAASGPLGAGWSLEGSSSITRCRQSREAGDFLADPLKEGDPQAIAFGTTDAFCMDGLRLLATNEAAPDGGLKVFYPETDPFTRVIAHGGTAADPSYFRVQRKDGSTSWYGQGGNARLSVTPISGSAAGLTWALNHFQDSLGNAVVYGYDQPAGTAGELLLSSVKYTVTATAGQPAAPSTSDNGFASITFTYSTLADAASEMGYIGGARVTHTRQLDRIEVFDGATRVRRYNLSYAASPSQSGARTLSQVQECGTDLSVCYKPTEFTWSPAKYTFAPDSEQTLTTNFADLVGMKLGDIDGDGRLDMVWWKNNDGCAGGNSRLYVSFAERTPSNQFTYATVAQPGTFCAPRNLQTKEDAWQLFDYDGDGRDDLLLAGAAGSNWRLYPASASVANRATPFDTNTDRLAADGVAIAIPTEAHAKTQLADFNGDGLLDVMYPIELDPDYSVIHVRFMERSGSTYKFSAAYVLDVQYPTDDLCYPLGQGHAEACRFQFFDAPGGRSTRLTDLNGDGRTDIVFQVTQEFCAMEPCQAFTGTDAVFNTHENEAPKPDTPPGPITYKQAWYFFAAGQRTPGNPGKFTIKSYRSYQTFTNGGTLPDSNKDLFLADLNGDGLTDLFYKDQSASDQYAFRLNYGRGLQDEVKVPGVLNGSLLQLADVDGDGHADVLYPPNDPGNHASRPFQVRRWQAVAGSQTGTMSAATAITGGGATVTNEADWINIFADIDGDGAADFLRAEVTGSGTGNSFLYASRGGTNDRYRARDVITQIKNGYGALTTLTYQPLTNRAVYVRDAGSRDDPDPQNADVSSWGRGSAVLDLLAPLYVVSEAASSAPTKTNANAVSHVKYRYAGAKLQGGGRGFLGFRQVTAIDVNDYGVGDNDGFVWTRTTYLQDFPFIGLPTTTVKTAKHGAFSFGTTDLVNLDSCFANIEATGQTCFTKIDTGTKKPLPVPELGGVGVSTSGQVYQCQGKTSGDLACPVPSGTYCQSSANVAALFGQPGVAAKTSEQLTSPPPHLNALNPAIAQQPLFPHIFGTAEIAADLGNGTLNNITYVSMCYEDGYGNVTYSETQQQDGSANPLQTKWVDNTYTNTPANWRLGRLTSSDAHSERPALSPIDRNAAFAYAMSGSASGLLTSEKVTQNDNANLTLRALTDYDPYGNKTVVYQCSGDLSDAQCKNLGNLKQRPVGANGPTTTVQRYTRTEYDAKGRYPVRTKLPYFNPNAANQWTEQIASAVISRSVMGDVTDQVDANGLHTRIAYGALGREYGRESDAGASQTTFLRWCTDVGVVCPAGMVFREETRAAGAPVVWTYFDVLGRARIKISESFNVGVAGKDLSAVCTHYDGHNRIIETSEPFFLANAEVAGAPSPASNVCSTAGPRSETEHDLIGRVTLNVRPDTSLESFSYVGLTTKRTNGLNKTWTEVKTALGETTTMSDPLGLTVTNVYDAEGKLRRVQRDGGGGIITTTVNYDSLGRKIQQLDPDLGNWSYEYNAAGELIRQTDAKGQVIEQDIDALGRVWRRTVKGDPISGPGCPPVDDRIFCNGFEVGVTSGVGTVVHLTQYDTATKGLGQVDFEQTTQGDGSIFRRTLTYDAIGRLSDRSTTFDATNYNETIQYDTLGRIAEQYDGSGSGVRSTYNARGYVATLTALNLTGVGVVNEVLEQNARGQITLERRGGNAAMTITRTYDPATGRPDTVCAGSACTIQDADYDFDVEGNLTARAKGASSANGYREAFTYDALNRLKNATLTLNNGVASNVPLTTLAYDKLGNICSKNASNYTYAGKAGCAGAGQTTASPHAVSAAFGKTYQYDANGNLTLSDAAGTANDRTLTYTAENQAASISTPTVTSRFVYGPDQARYKRTDQRANGPNAGTTITRYVGSLEFIQLPNGTNQVKRYIAGVAMIVTQSGSPTVSPYYLFSDHLGSIERLANANGTVIEAMSFDAHGTRRDALDWQGAAASLPQLTTHGFAGLEHVDDVGLVHMNGRIYDPELGRFAQADPFIEKDATQGLNRYTYVLNNPLSYTDPSGYGIGSFVQKYWRAIAAIVIIVVAPYLLGAIGVSGFWGAVATGFAAGAVSTGSFQGGVYGAFSAGLFYGIGTYFQNASWAQNANGTGLTSAAAAAKVMAHGIVGGVMSNLQGDSFGNGFVAAGVTEASGAGIDGLGTAPDRIFAAAIVGGTVSALTGGKFANGAITAAFSRAFNSEAHPAVQEDEPATTLELWYEPAWGDYEHTVVVLTDADGKQWYIRAGPGDRAGGDVTKAKAQANYPGSSGSAGGSYGDVVTQWGPFVPGSIDYTTSPIAVQSIGIIKEPLASVASKLAGFGQAVGSSHIQYNPINANSNSFAFDAVASLGFPRPIPSATVQPLGWNHSLGVNHGK